MCGIIIIPGVAGAGIQQMLGRYGSDLHLPVPQLSDIGSDEGFDVYGADGAGLDGHIGNCHGGFKGFGLYRDHLQFNKETGTIVLKNFSPTDGLVFKVTKWGTKEEIKFNVTMADALKSEERSYTGNNTCTEALISVGLSVDPPICLLAIWLVMKLLDFLQKNTEAKSCPETALLFLLGKNLGDYKERGCLINYMTSLVFQVISMVLLGLCERTWWLLGTGLCTLILAGVWIYRACNSNGGMRSGWCTVLLFLERLASLAFPACVFFWYCSTYGIREELWAAAVSCMLSFILKLAIFTLCRLRGTTTSSSYSDNKGSPQLNPDDPSTSDLLLRGNPTPAV